MFESLRPRETPALAEFLAQADLTRSGLDAPSVRLWVHRDGSGIAASAGFELSADGHHALVRSTAIRPDLRRQGMGLSAASFVVDRARTAGAGTAWLFSRRSGPFWQRLGFTRTTTDELAAALPDAYQVKLFRSSGQLDREVAWRRPLGDALPGERPGGAARSDVAFEDAGLGEP